VVRVEMPSAVGRRCDTANRIKGDADLV